jgi:pimeloyl-ACP methyl ester carboxylesterase
VCQDVIDLMDALGIEQASLGSGSFGAAIAFGCTVRYPERVWAIFPSNIAGGVICNAYLAMKLFKSAQVAMAQGIKAVVDAFDPDDRFAPFTLERAQYDPMYRKTLEAMPPEDFAHVIRDTISALFDGPYLILGMREQSLKGIRTPTLMMPGNNDIHPRRVAEQVHRLIPNAHWAKVRPHTEEPEHYVSRVLQFVSEVEASAEDRVR